MSDTTEQRAAGVPRRRMVTTALAIMTIIGISCHTLEVPTSPTAGPFTDVFTSQLGVGGTATRWFTLHEEGTVSVTLTSDGPPATLEVGLEVGIRMAAAPATT